MFSSAAVVAAIAGYAAAKTIDIGVGDGGLVFKPNTTTAAVGDTLAFHFYPRMHSVVQGSYENGCQPLSNNAFFSGYYSAQTGQQNNTMFTVRVNDTNPLWIYCSEAKHCQEGMVMVVNPPSGNQRTLAGYAANAAKASDNKGLASAQGGQAVPNAVAGAGSTNSSSSAGSQTTPGAAPAGSTPAHSGSSSVSSSGTGSQATRASTAGAAAMTGMGVVGGAVVAGLAALL